jgi:APA family basic amino acid/polyamine antiporter
MADQVDVSGGAPGPTSGTAGGEGASQFGLTAAMALIVGSIIGVGIFNLPTSLAFYGPITLISMALTTVGALELALLFAALSRRLPADGGPYAYARAAFGNPLGFANAWSYWITAWAGNAAIAVGWVLYVEHFINKGHTKWVTVLLVLIGLWIPAVINLSGVKNMGSVQVVTTVIKFVVLAFMSTVGLFFISSANFTPWNVSKESTITAIGGGMAIALFSYLGVETAAVAAAKVRNPDRNIPRATILGTIATAVVYMLSLIAVFGIIPSSKLAAASAPFSDAANAIFGGTWAGNVMAVAVIISGFGALNGWTMICAEMPLAAAGDGLFPARFKRISKNGVPAFGIVASTVLASVAMIINYLGSNGPTVFTTLVLMTGITAAIPYAFSALAQIKWRLADHREMQTPRFARDMIVAVLSVVFSVLFIWYSRNTGHSFTDFPRHKRRCVPVYMAQRRHDLPLTGDARSGASPVGCERDNRRTRERTDRVPHRARRGTPPGPAPDADGHGCVLQAEHVDAQEGLSSAEVLARPAVRPEQVRLRKAESRWHAFIRRTPTRCRSSCWWLRGQPLPAEGAGHRSPAAAADRVQRCWACGRRGRGGGTRCSR